MSGATAPKPWRTARIDLKADVLQGGRPSGPPFLFPFPQGEKAKAEHAATRLTHRYAKRNARARLQMSTLRRGQAVCGVPRSAAILRSLRARLRLHRCR